MLLVVHIPKTAGTSLWVALKKSYGGRRVAFDYGDQSDVTSVVVRQHMYKPGRNPAAGELIKVLSEKDCVALTGHFPLSKYSQFVEPRKVVAFVREPLVRACSEYLHRSQDGSFTGRFEEFIESVHFRNLQARTLAGLTGEEFVGITEYYSESVKGINQRFGLRIRARRDNRGVKGGGAVLAGQLDPALVRRFYDLNHRDVLLYQSMLARFDEGRDSSTGRSILRFPDEP